MDKIYTVYRHVSPDGKIYIGCTGENPADRWSKGYGHNRELINDFDIFGWDNFKHEIIASDLTRDEAYKMERELISEYNTTDPDYGYNISSGGYGRTGCYFSHTEESKEKIRKASTGRHHTDATKRKLSEARMGRGNPMYGKHPSEETRRKLSESHKNKRRYSATYSKHSSTRKRRVMCVETGKVYESISAAAADTGWSSSMICSYCRKKRGNENRWIYID